MSGGNLPNLGYSDAATIKNLEALLLSDAFAAAGMPSFKDRLSKDKIVKIVAFIKGTADAVREN